MPSKKQVRRAAEPLTIDFSEEEAPKVNGKKLTMTPKQIRARARRKKIMSREEYEILYKPIEEWDEEELARGRPRDKNGGFRGKKPAWLSREIHEAAMERFKYIIKAEVNAQGSVAMGVIKQLMTDEEVDEKGKWRTPASVRLQASQLMLEHTIGKPTVHVEQEISVKLQALMATATVGPGADIDEEVLQQVAMSEYERAYGELGQGDDIEDAEVIDD
jgi:hypothetical protein